jgi:hypothetical protein
MTIVLDDSRVVNKLEASLTDDARVVIYDRHIFIVQAAGLQGCVGIVQVLSRLETLNHQESEPTWRSRFSYHEPVTI